MLAILLFLETSAMANEPPRPLPDRWRLELVPDDVSATPNGLWSKTWYYGRHTRGGPGSLSEWLTFVTPKNNRTAETNIVHQQGHRNERNQTYWSVTGYTAPVAVHGSLLEFDRRLYTFILAKQKSYDRELLCLGCAIQPQANVWYEAKGEARSDGTIRVEEILAEFSSDPQTELSGSVKVNRFSRWSTKPDGNRITFNGLFNCITRGSRRIVVIQSDDGTKRLKLRIDDFENEKLGYFGTGPLPRRYFTVKTVLPRSETGHEGGRVSRAKRVDRQYPPQPERLEPSPRLVEFPSANP